MGTSIAGSERLVAPNQEVVDSQRTQSWLERPVVRVVGRPEGGNMSRGSSAVKQKRDARGRFAKLGQSIYYANGADPIERYDLMTITPPRRRLNVLRLISHHRIAIAYVMVCFIAGAIGGYFGVTVGLEGLGL
jgi:hypothetical protein